MGSKHTQTPLEVETGNKLFYTCELTPPADWYNHGVVFDFLKLASVLQGLKDCLPGVKTPHTLQGRNEQSKTEMKT